MLHYIEDNKGFQTEQIVNSERPLKIGLIDADLLDHGTKHPNLALLKMSGFCKSVRLKDGQKHNVRLICSYSELSGGVLLSQIDFDVIAISRVFKFTNLPDTVQRLVDEHLAYYGGTGWSFVCYRF